MARALVGALLALLALLACGSDSDEARAPRAENQPAASNAPEPWSDAWLLAAGERYLGDADHRRASMERSLRNHENLYSRTRIASYGLGDRGWDLLPEWNPRTRTIGRTDRAELADGHTPALGGAEAIWDGATPDEMADWIALGREVFHRYPLRADAWVEHGLRDPARADDLGLRESRDGTLPGVVVFADLDGRERVGITCALCHTNVLDGAIIEGEARRAIDYGKLMLDLASARGTALDPAMAARMTSWGPGRADITEDDDEDPVAIPDLWGLRHETALTQAATIRHVGPVSLALRQETQYLYANHHRSRPPRVLVFALVTFLYALTPPPRAAPPEEPALFASGERIFDAECRTCHSNAAYGGAPVRASRIGTDPALSRGVARGTGVYRPAPLIRVADAAPYLHHGAIATLEDVLDPARLTAAYEGPLGPGPVSGHEYGLRLAPDDRAALLSFLRTL